MEIEITTDILNAVELFRDKLSQAKLKLAVQRAMNKTVVSIRGHALVEIRKRLNLKESTLRKQYVSIERAVGKGQTLGSLSAAVVFSGRPIPLLLFVKGNKNVIEQKGIPVKRRRKLKVQVVPGKTVTLNGAFIQKGPKSIQVFRRNKRGGFVAQSVPGVAHTVSRKGILYNIRRRANTRFRTALDQEISAILRGYTKD